MRMLILGGILVVVSLFGDIYFTIDHLLTYRATANSSGLTWNYMDVDPVKRDGVFAGGVLGSLALIGGFGGCVVRKLKESKTDAISIR